MTRLARLLCLLIVAVLAWLPARAADEILYVYPDQSVWTTEMDEHGLPANPLLKLARALFDEAKLPWRAQALPATRMFNQLKNEQANFSMLVKAPALQECCLVSRLPVASTELRVYWLADAPPIQKREDLAGKSLITILGYSYGDMAAFLNDEKNAIAKSAVPKHQSAFDMLAQRRGDYLLDYAGPAGEVLEDKNIPGIRFIALGRMDVYLVLSKAYPNAPKTMARLEAIAQKLDREKIIRGK